MANNKFYRFELQTIRSGASSILDVFNFAINPQTWNVDNVYRDAIYKTFGGTHIDIQGIDNPVIRISGTLAGMRKRSGWTKVSSRSMDATEALKYFRDNIWKYPSNPKYKTNYRDMTVKFYDVTMGESYFVHINNFSYSKDKSQPFWINFTIQMTVVDPPKPKAKGALAGTLQKYKDSLDGVFNGIQAIQDQVYGLRDTILSTVTTATGFVDATVSFVADSMNTVTSAADAILNLPGDAASIINDSVKKFNDVADALDNAIDTLYFMDEYKEYTKNLFSEMSQNLRSVGYSFQKAVTKNSYNDVEQSGSLVPINVSGINAAGQSYVNNPPANTSIASSSNPSVPIDHVETVIIKENTDIATIAIQYFGDESMVPVLIEYNDLETAFLYPGQIIKVPISQEQKIIQDNLVISQTIDNFGKGLVLTENGEMQANSTGDLLTVTGLSNIVQTIQNILQIDIGSQLSDQSFGFSKQDILGKGGTEDLLKLIEIKIKDSILKDPRISDVTDYSITVNGDTIRINGVIVLHDSLTESFEIIL